MLNIFHDIPLCVLLGTNSRFAVVGSKLDASWNIMKNIQQVCGPVIKPVWRDSVHQIPRDVGSYSQNIPRDLVNSIPPNRF